MNMRTLAAAVAALALTSGTFAQGQKNHGIKMMPSPLAKNAGLQNAKGHADVDVRHGTVALTVQLAPGTRLAPGTVLEGWLTTAGRDTASEADQKYGPAFGKKEVAMKSRQIPYALSTGLLHRVGSSRTYVGRFQIANLLTPYGGVAVTLESDGNRGNYDPRPGTPLMAGMIKGGKMAGMMGAM